MPTLAFVLMVLGYGLAFAGGAIIYLGFEFKRENSVASLGIWFRSMFGPGILMLGINIVVLWVILFPEIALKP